MTQSAVCVCVCVCVRARVRAHARMLIAFISELKEFSSQPVLVIGTGVDQLGTPKHITQHAGPCILPLRLALPMGLELLPASLLSLGDLFLLRQYPLGYPLNITSHHRCHVIT